MSQTKAQLVQPVGIVTGTGINVTGVITATSFVGSGEGLTGVASTDNIITGTAATFNNTVNVNSTLTANSGFTTNATNTNLKVTGVGTFAGAGTFKDDLTLEGASSKNVVWDNSDGALEFADSAMAAFGADKDMRIYHSGSTNFIDCYGSYDLKVNVQGASESAANFRANGPVELYHNNTQRLMTTGVGASCVGVMSATSFAGDGSSLTGVGDSIAPWHYNPDPGETNAEGVTTDTGIGITFNKKVVAGSGTATLKIVNAGVAGTTVQSWGVSSCTFNVTEFTMGALVSNLDRGRTYQLDIPATFIDDAAGNSYVGTAYTFATTEDPGNDPLFEATAWSWGLQSKGELGQNDSNNVSSPKQVPGTTWGQLGRVSYYSRHRTAIKTDGTLWVVGENDWGQLGQNESANSHKSSPVQIPGTTWATSACGSDFTVATKTDGTLWIWGYNDGGHLGLNEGPSTHYSSPVQVGSDQNWAGTNVGYLAAGARHVLAIKQDGTLWSWGKNNGGAVGDNSNVDKSSPTQVGSATNWKYGAADIEKSAAINTDDEAFVWGKNQHGQLGTLNNDRTWRSSPVQVPGSWASWAFGDDMGAAIKTNGTLWTFGHNGYGQLGQNNKTEYSSPVQIPGTSWNTTIYSLSMATSAAAVMQTDGTAWVWGWNQNGQLGLNNSTHYSSPVQLNSSHSDHVQVDMGNFGWLLRE